MESISKEEYEKMTEEEKLLYCAYVNKTNQDIEQATEALSKALENPELMEKASSAFKKIFNGKAVNKNPLTEIPNPEMRLYRIDDHDFESMDELLHYCRMKNKSTEGLIILDYYRNLAGRSDVIRKQDCNSIMLYAAVDEDGYGIYNNERSIYRGEFVWEYDYGSIRNMYKPFRDKGIVFENDIYAKQDERIQHILKYNLSF